MATESEFLAYVAGFFDGEGCIQIPCNERGNYTLRINVCQKSEAVLQYIRSRLGGEISNGKGVKILYWHGSNAVPVLEQILPWLVVKKSQAELAIEFGHTIVTRGTPVGPVVNARRAEIADEVQRLKKVF